jgi:uncharacterized LabA/DUF88 family protein
MDEPAQKRAMAFFDGQNLFRHAKTAFGHIHPNYDPKSLFGAICTEKGWLGKGIRFYTGVPSAIEDPMWRGYWNNRLLQLSRAGVLVTSRELRYHDVASTSADGSKKVERVAHEKGIDVRLALDVVRLARQKQYDVAVVFSQDQDLSEVVAEVVEIAKEQSRWIKVVSAFPSGPQASSKRGINGADWFEIGRELYDANLDPRDYRPKKPV